jgi:hypothetical protein
MDTFNNFVTERELLAHLDPIRDDVAEIKADVKLLLRPDENAWLGPRGRGIVTTVVAGLALSGATVATSVALSLLLH